MKYKHKYEGWSPKELTVLDKTIVNNWYKWTIIDEWNRLFDEIFSDCYHENISSIEVLSNWYDFLSNRRPSKSKTCTLRLRQ
jgi:hypothetical protein